MFRTLAAAGLAGLLTATAVIAQDRIPTVASIEVEADLAAVENPAAAAYWNNLAADLQSAIATRVADRTAEDGVQISVDVSEVELSGGASESLGLADTRLIGKVRVRNQKDPSRDQTYDLQIDVNGAQPFFPAGTDVPALPADSRAYYDAMVNAFADAVVRNLA